MQPMDDEFTYSERIAYFTMEIALKDEIPTYAGGLGVLAGDTVGSAADLDLPLVTVSLVSRQGFFRQSLDADGQQSEAADPWRPEDWARPVRAKVSVPVEDRSVWVGGWFYLFHGHMGGRQPVVLLDTDLDDNAPEDRQITDHLYGGDQEYRLKQEIVLGIGGVRMLHALGFTVSHYHMNEGHSALLALELMRRYAYPEEDVRPGENRYNIPRVRQHCIFTTHTPVEAGHDQFPYDLVQRLLGDYIDLDSVRLLAGRDRLNMTRLALNLSEFVNGVAKRHAETSRKLFPGYRVRSVTNGVHPFTWTGEGVSRLYDHYVPGWCHEPELLVRADRIPAEELWAAHLAARQRLVERVREACGVALDPELPILGFARRMTAYKRPELLFSDLDQLRAIAARRPFQVVISGKAHPRDEQGKQAIRHIHDHMRALGGGVPTAYIPDYDAAVARDLVAGTDVWLNTPKPPMEASGTSGMKAAFNGVPSLSVLDGWWLEGCIEGVTGWAIGEDGGDGGDTNGAIAADLYRKLDEVVLPLHHDDRDGWVRVMLGAITKNASFFNSHRMMRRYASDAYIH